MDAYKVETKFYELIIWYGERGAKTRVGVFPESFCRAYCKKFAGKDDLHIQCNEVSRDFVRKEAADYVL